MNKSISQITWRKKEGEKEREERKERKREGRKGRDEGGKIKHST